MSTRLFFSSFVQFKHDTITNPAAYSNNVWNAILHQREVIWFCVQNRSILITSSSQVLEFRYFSVPFMLHIIYKHQQARSETSRMIETDKKRHSTTSEKSRHKNPLSLSLWSRAWYFFRWQLGGVYMQTNMNGKCVVCVVFLGAWVVGFRSNFTYPTTTANNRRSSNQRVLLDCRFRISWCTYLIYLYGKVTIITARWSPQGQKC